MPELPQDLQEFNNFLIALCREYDSRKLPLNRAIEILSHTKKIMISLAPDSKEFAMLIKSLSSLVFVLPQSKEFNLQFEDVIFLRRIFRYSILNPMEHSPFIIFTTYLRGEFLEDKTNVNGPSSSTFVPFFDTLLSCRAFLTGIQSRFEKARESTTSAVNLQFMLILAPLLSWPEHSTHCIVICQHMRIIAIGKAFREAVTIHKTIPVSQYGQSLQMLVHHFVKIWDKWSRDLTIRDYKRNSIIDAILDDCVTAAVKYSHLDKRASDNKKLISSRLTDHPKQYLVENYTANELFLVRIFVNSPQGPELLSKSEKHSALVGEKHRKFPLGKFLFAVSSLLVVKLFDKSNPSYSSVQKYTLYVDEVYSLLLSKSFDYWISSQASNNNETDFDFIINLLKIDVSYFNLCFKENNDFETCLSKVKKELDYEKARKIQLRFLKDDQYLDYIQNSDIEEYCSGLLESVKLFILNERMLEVTKGTICYLKNPLEIRDAATKDASRCFVSVSPKRNALIYVSLAPGFKINESDPAELHSLLESKNAKQILINSIKRVHAEQYKYGRSVNFEKGLGVSTDAVKTIAYNNDTSRNNKIQSYFGFKKVATKIALLDRSNNVAFQFFTDTNRNATIWTDMLNSMIDNFSFNKVTKETKTHVEELFDIKRSIQLLPLSQLFESQLSDLYAVGGKMKAKEDNFLQIKHLNFDISSESEKSSIRSVSTYNKREKRAKKDVILEEDSVPEIESDLEYSYDELMSIADGFYYS